MLKFPAMAGKLLRKKAVTKKTVRAKAKEMVPKYANQVVYQGPRNKVARGTLLIGEDCSGLGTLALAAAGLKLPYRHVFCSDSDEYCQKVLQQTHEPDFLYKDCVHRDQGKVPRCDIYGAGPPCQPFSPIGLGKGVSDPRGLVVQGCLDYQKQHLPTIMLLEQVPALKGKKHKALFNHVKKRPPLITIAFAFL